MFITMSSKDTAQPARNAPNPSVASPEFSKKLNSMPPLLSESVTRVYALPRATF